MNKMTVKLVTAISTLCSAAAFAADEAPAAAAATTATGPKISFAAPQYDFGKAKAGEPVKHTYLFPNTCHAMLILSHVQPSCGCTTAGEWSRETAAGQT